MSTTATAPRSTDEPAEPRPWTFDELNTLSIAITAALAVAVFVYYRLDTTRNFYLTNFYWVKFLGLTHFAVGYHFFFRSAGARPEGGRARAVFAAKIAACVAMGYWAYRVPSSMPLVLTLIYLHNTENAVFHAWRLDSTGAGGGARSIASNVLFPLMLILLIARLTPRYVTELYNPQRLVQLGMVLACMAFVRSTMPKTSWREGLRYAGRNHMMIAYFAVVALFVREGSFVFDYFIIWHYVTWVVFTWIQRPDQRALLVKSHLFFGAIYQVLFFLEGVELGAGAQAALVALIGPASFMGQTTTHILMAFAFRSYPKPAGSSA